jgi:predicted ATPase
LRNVPCTRREEFRVPAAGLYIVTGAPGSGKTAILDRVGAGIRCVGEAAREVLVEQRSVDGIGTPDRDASLFLDLLLERSIDKHVAAENWEGSVVFDRGIPDCVAYAVMLGVDATRSLLASQRHRYNNEVLLLEPWEEIYVVDEERTMSFADTVAFHRALTDAYERAGYSLVEVPRDSIDNRAAFLRDFVAHR